MELGYDPQTHDALLLATPDELRELANRMEEKLATTRPGESLTVAEIQAVHGWTGEAVNLKLRISPKQF